MVYGALHIRQRCNDMEVPMRQTDHDWFNARFRDRQLSLRDYHKLTGLNPGTTSRMLRGITDPTLPNVIELADTLKQPLHEVIRRLGYPTVRTAQASLVGEIDNSGAVVASPAPQKIAAPDLDAVEAYTIAATQHMLSGALAFVSAPAPARECVGKMAVCTVRGSERMVLLQPGLSRTPGQYRLAAVFGSGVSEQDYPLTTAKPVLWVRM